MDASKRLTSGLHHEESNSGTKTGNGNSSSCSMKESDMLKKEIKKIEKQNSAQQRRLHQLEKLVMQLMHGRTSQVLPCLSPNTSALTPGTPRLMEEKESEKIVPSWTDYEDQATDYRTDGGNELTSDLVSLMEEFDRNGRENGMTYGVTPSYGLSDSHDIDLDEGPDGVSLPNEDFCKSTPLVRDVYSSPLPIFITPTYQDWTYSTYNYKGAEEPQCSPQLCFTTPVLLTSNALREAEQNHDVLDSNDTVGYFQPERWSIAMSPKPVSQSQEECRGGSMLAKTNPFSNLLAWIHQTSKPNVKQHTASDKEHWPAGDQHGSLGLSEPPGFCTPGNESIVSVSERVRKWSQSLRLPFLSPMPESLCSDKEANVSPAYENPEPVHF